jgi:hypothetical protein
MRRDMAPVQQGCSARPRPSRLRAALVAPWGRGSSRVRAWRRSTPTTRTNAEQTEMRPVRQRSAAEALVDACAHARGAAELQRLARRSCEACVPGASRCGGAAQAEQAASRGERAAGSSRECAVLCSLGRRAGRLKVVESDGGAGRRAARRRAALSGLLTAAALQRARTRARDCTASRACCCRRASTRLRQCCVDAAFSRGAGCLEALLRRTQARAWLTSAARGAAGGRSSNGGGMACARVRSLPPPQSLG